jgi:hypothetical protein
VAGIQSPQPPFFFIQLFMFMKYIISEKRLERLVINYLNTLSFEEGDSSFFGFDIMYNDSEVIAYRNGDKKLYISTDLIKDMISLFNLSHREVMDYVRIWFRNKYDVEVKSLWLLFPDEPFTF